MAIFDHRDYKQYNNKVHRAQGVLSDTAHKNKRDPPKKTRKTNKLLK